MDSQLAAIPLNPDPLGDHRVTDPIARNILAQIDPEKYEKEPLYDLEITPEEAEMFEALFGHLEQDW